MLEFGYDFDAIYEAGRAEALVGGDWFDAFRLLDGSLVISVGDVAGSGLRAAITMASVRQTIRGVAHVHPDPGLMLEFANRVVRSEDPSRFVTAFVGVIDRNTQTLKYQSAGHLPPILRLPDATCIPLEIGGVPLGVSADGKAPSRTLWMPPGSLLVLYTDGLVESTHDIEAGEQRLLAALKTESIVSSARPAKELYDAVLAEGSTDDVAILTVRTVGEPQVLRWTLDAGEEHTTRRARLQIMERLAQRGYPENLCRYCEIILAELVGNLLRYAPGHAEMTFEWVDRHPVIRLRDCGPGFEFAAKLPFDPYSESGRGLFVIAELAADFNVTRRPDGGSDACVVLRPAD